MLQSSHILLRNSPTQQILTFTVMETLRARASAIKADARAKTSREGWILEKQPMTFADEGTWSNRDTDVTPLERRTWTSWTVLGYWMSDALSVQSWAGASAIIAVGLTWYVSSCKYYPSREKCC